MHGGANAQNLAMHGGGVLPLTWYGSGDNLLTWLIRGGVRGKEYPATHHGGLQPCRASWRGAPDKTAHPTFSAFPSDTFVHLIFRRIFLTSNKFIQKLDLNIYLMILILYYKY